MNKTITAVLLSLIALASCGDSNSLNEWTLSTSDWAAVCESGSINKSAGCKGDVSSQAMQKINLVGNDFLGNTSITGGGTDTVWIRQIGTDTACIENNARVQVRVNDNSNVWKCGVALPQATLVGIAFEFLGGSYIGGSADGDIGTVANLSNIAAHTDADNNTYAQFSTTAEQQDITAYVICVSTNNNGEAKAFKETPRVALDGHGC